MDVLGEDEKENIREVPLSIEHGLEPGTGPELMSTEDMMMEYLREEPLSSNYGLSYNTESTRFCKARLKELHGLIELDTFTPVHISLVGDHRVYDYVFVDK